MNGILCINKPQEYTSFDVVARIRGMSKTKRVGHSGTLDPMATGVLPIFLGAATKACNLLPDDSKCYEAAFALGKETDTLDCWGTIKKVREAHVRIEEIQAILPRFTGEIEQIPPMYSAIKVNGKKLYELAREGKEIERKARTITIFAINIVRFLPPDRFEIDVDCSKGTYIRTLCSDIGKALGCGAHMAELTRTRTGSFALEDAITLGELQTMADEGRQEEAFLSMEAALSDFPKIIVSPKSTKMLYNGGRVYAKFYEVEKELTAGDIAAVFDSEHHLVGLYEVRDEEGFYIKPFKMLI